VKPGDGIVIRNVEAAVPYQCAWRESPVRMPSPAFFAVSSELTASVVYSADAVVVFSHDWLWLFLVINGSTSHDFAGDLVSKSSSPFGSAGASEKTGMQKPEVSGASVMDQLSEPPSLPLSSAG
jgi:hypothetical protein